MDVIGLIHAIAQLRVVLVQIESYLHTLFQPNLIVAALLNDSLGLLLNVWFNFILSTKDIETAGGGPFVKSATIQRFEPIVQLAANAALALVAMWASYRVMWGHGLHSQYTARILLPRLVMGVVLVNFSTLMFQVAIDASNTACEVIQRFGTVSPPSSWPSELLKDPHAPPWQIITTLVLAGGYDVLAITYLLRYAILVVLAITAPIAGLLFALPETHHVFKQWMSHFITNLLMQPLQLFVLSIGFALENNGRTPLRHLFALAALLIVLKVPGALGGSEKAAHKLESTVHTAFRHLGHALAKV
jgi:TrbL/VirB6 plasmid conjugal transfer protein